MNNKKIQDRINALKEDVAKLDELINSTADKVHAKELQIKQLLKQLSK